MEQDKNLDSELGQNNMADEVVSSSENEFREKTMDVPADFTAQETETAPESQNPPETEADDTNEAQNLITVRPVKFQEFEMTEPNRSIKRNLDIMQDISMHISVELGRTKATIKDVMDYKEGSIVELDKIAGEQVEVYANNKLVAKGEVIVIEDKFGVRVTSTSLPKAIQ